MATITVVVAMGAFGVMRVTGAAIVAALVAEAPFGAVVVVREAAAGVVAVGTDSYLIESSAEEVSQMR